MVKTNYKGWGGKERQWAVKMDNWNQCYENGFKKKQGIWQWWKGCK